MRLPHSTPQPTAVSAHHHPRNRILGATDAGRADVTQQHLGGRLVQDKSILAIGLFTHTRVHPRLYTQPKPSAL